MAENEEEKQNTTEEPERIVMPEEDEAAKAYKKQQRVERLLIAGEAPEDVAKKVQTTLRYVKGIRTQLMKAGLLPKTNLQLPEEDEITEAMGGKRIAPSVKPPQPSINAYEPYEVVDKFLNTMKGFGVTDRRADAVADLLKAQYRMDAMKSNFILSQYAGQMDGSSPVKVNGSSKFFDEEFRDMLKEMQKMKMQAEFAREILRAKEGGDSMGNSEIESLKEEIRALRQKNEIDKLRDELKLLLEKKGGSNETNEYLKSLEQRLNDLREDKRLSEIKQLLLTNQVNNSKNDEFLQMYKERDKSIEQLRAELEKARTEMLANQLTNKISRLEEILASQGGSATAKLQQTVEEMKALKEIAGELGMKEHPDKPSALGEIKDLVGGVVRELKDPLLKPIGEAVAENMRRSAEEQARKNAILQQYAEAKQRLLEQQAAQQVTQPAPEQMPKKPITPEEGSDIQVV